MTRKLPERHFGGRARLPQFERLRRIRRRQPAGGLENVGDVLDLSDGTDQHGGADASNGDEVKGSAALMSTRCSRVARVGLSGCKP
jgi:hypothetical protein